MIPKRSKTLFKKAGLGQVGCDFQQHIAGNMTTRSAGSCLFPQAARASVKGCEQLHGFESRLRDDPAERDVKDLAAPGSGVTGSSGRRL